MITLTGQIVVFTVLILLTVSQLNNSSQNISYDDYKVESCCPKGFTQIGNYCVQCPSPTVFDSIDQKCKPCPLDQLYNPNSKQCDCKASCQPPRQINSHNVCECPIDRKGFKRVWNEQDSSCTCTSELPLWNGKQCVSCPIGANYDPKEHQCFYCPQGFMRGPDGPDCIPQF